MAFKPQHYNKIGI